MVTQRSPLRRCRITRRPLRTGAKWATRALRALAGDFRALPAWEICGLMASLARCVTARAASVEAASVEAGPEEDAGLDSAPVSVRDRVAAASAAATDRAV